MKNFPYWHADLQEVFSCLKSNKDGLSSNEAGKRLKRDGPNTIKPKKKSKGLLLFLNQFKSPLILLLIGAAILSVSLKSHTDAFIISTIVFLSGLLGFFQERGALNILEKLSKLIENKTSVLRNGQEIKIPIEKVVIGDVVLLKAGDIVPADCLITETHHLFIDESLLTGESLPVEKNAKTEPLESPPLKRKNCVYLGTVVVSGYAQALVVATGKNTKWGEIGEKVRFRPIETAFETGVKNFGFLLLQITFVFVIVVFTTNILLHKSIIESLLFSLAIAVGLTPQLLPAIISVNLAHGARKMAKKKVIVKRLASIENFGQMDILCSDKTGTITEGKIALDQTAGAEGQKNEKVAFYGFLNAYFQTGYTNPLDLAILDFKNHVKWKKEAEEWKKIEEIPFDFTRKKLSIIFEHKNQKILISKGAVKSIFSVCSQVEKEDGSVVPFHTEEKLLSSFYEESSKKGLRTIAIAYGAEEEKNLTFLGFITFLDPIKPNIASVINDLKSRGITFKILTGDNHLVAAHVASSIGLSKEDIITGEEVEKLKDPALRKIVEEKNIFAEIEPSLKEKIILSLRKSDHIIGFLGDGVNDVSALHSADVGIAVNKGADVTKEAADIVLLHKDLLVLKDGVEEGRRTFTNTLKYIYMAASANFGNMISMGGASLFLTFLPLLPKQVLLTNFFSDLPEMALATDRVDKETMKKPLKWDLPFIRKFMIIFGLLSSLPDFMTFGTLLLLFHENESLFRTGWFLESVISATLIVLSIRTKKPFWRSRPSLILFSAVLTISVGISFLPYTALGRLFDLTPMPLYYFAFMVPIILFYIISVEISKKFIFK